MTHLVSDGAPRVNFTTENTSLSLHCQFDFFPVRMSFSVYYFHSSLCRRMSIKMFVIRKATQRPMNSAVCYCQLDALLFTRPSMLCCCLEFQIVFTVD